ncbi:MAG TPA: hypothetical protein VIE36_19355 [Methylomirabilota bacterium]|jgi:hypothetical protein
MIAGLVLGLLADLVFESVTSMRRAFATEMDRYLARRGFVATPPPARPELR